jgi:hypothetical protein
MAGCIRQCMKSVYALQTKLTTSQIRTLDHGDIFGDFALLSLTPVHYGAPGLWPGFTIKVSSTGEAPKKIDQPQLMPREVRPLRQWIDI